MQEINCSTVIDLALPRVHHEEAYHITPQKLPDGSKDLQNAESTTSEKVGLMVENPKLILG